MNILILYDRESEQYGNLDLFSQVFGAVQKAGCEADAVLLNGDEIRSCQGCFRCWIKTPGLCTITDDCINEVCGRLVRSDAVIVLSRICYGGYSYDIKSFFDRSIPNLSPLFEIFRGEMRHKMRYERFPYLITVGYGESTMQECDTFAGLMLRNALNMRPPKHFVLTVKNPDETRETMGVLENILSHEVRL